MSTTDFLVRQYPASSYHNSVRFRSSGVNTTYTAAGFENGCPATKAVIFDHTAGPSITFRRDGVSEAPVTPTTQGTGARNVFAYGRLPTSAPTDVDYTFLRHRLVYDRVLTTLELQQLETWATGEMSLGWKAGYSTAASYGNGSNAWLVIALLGQSNMVGAGTPYAGDGVATNIYALNQDGFISELVNEPTFDGTNAPFIQGNTGGASVGRRLGELLRAAGETRNILFVPVAKGGTTSTNWANAVATDPPPIGSSSPIGFAKYWIDEALKAPNSEVIFVVYQGEFNAQSAPLAAIWSPDWVLIQDNFNTRYASHIVKTKPWFVVQLPATPWPGGPDWASVRANQATHCSTTRTDSTLVPAPDGPWIDAELHLDAGAIRVLAASLSTAIRNGT